MLKAIIALISPPLWVMHWLMIAALLWFYLADVFVLLSRWLGLLGYVLAIPVAVIASPVLLAFPWLDQWIHHGEFRMVVLAVWICVPLTGWLLGYLEDYPSVREEERRWREMNQKP